MSEIFDFLKKTEGKGDKRRPVDDRAPILESRVVDLAAEEVEESPENTALLERESSNVEICGSNTFDMTGASLQIKNVLDPLTIVGEQFRLLRSKLGLMQKQRGIKIILITSSIPDEGKTFTASGLAGVFAQEPGKRVLLIDADMRKPKSGWNFGLNGSGSNAGLSDVLSGKQEYKGGLLRFMNPAFHFLPAGPLPENPSELLGSGNFERMLKESAESFDWIIIDSPPVLALSDTSLIAPLCDAVVLVVRAGSTPSKLVLNAIKEIGHDRICGVVMNRQKQIHSSRYYYQYYYRKSK